MVKEVIVRIGRTDNNFAAIIEGLEGFVCAADSFRELKTEITEGLKFHLEGLKEDGEPVPDLFKSEYKLIYKWDVESLMEYYKGIFTRAALERLTGINQTQLGHYAAGRSKPRIAQVRKLEKALHELGEELSGISF